MYRNRFARAARAHKHILLIEDNPDGRESLRLLLSILGHRVDVAADGVEGVRKALAVRPEVVLVDLGLPRLNGCEVARRIRAALGSEVVLLAYTAFDDDETKEQVVQAGFNAHLVKPAEWSELAPWLEDEPISFGDLVRAGASMTR